MREKGKRKVVDRMEEEKSWKFRADPLVQKAYLAIEAKRQQCDKRNAQRQREKWRMEETEELHELKEQLRKEPELRRHEKEAQQEQVQQGAQLVQIEKLRPHR